MMFRVGEVGSSCFWSSLGNNWEWPLPLSPAVCTRCVTVSGPITVKRLSEPSTLPGRSGEHLLTRFREESDYLKRCFNSAQDRGSSTVSCEPHSERELESRGRWWQNSRGRGMQILLPCLTTCLFSHNAHCCKESVFKVGDGGGGGIGNFSMKNVILPQANCLPMASLLCVVWIRHIQRSICPILTRRLTELIC